jgi:hypothetical protein
VGGKGKGFFGGINRTSPIHTAAGCIGYKCSKSDSRENPRIGEIIDTLIKP